MESNNAVKCSDKATFYKILIVRLEGLLSSEEDWLANLSNASALLYNNLDNINWLGFYLFKNGELVLGPFQGKTACTRIKLGKGVCGTSAQKRETLLVSDVHEFEGHIACDSASRSEIVVPIIANNDLAAVLDVDSPVEDRFDDIDKLYLEKFIDKLNKYIDWSKVC
jgi:L-methionine (R)-S-oxide reductase